MKTRAEYNILDFLKDDSFLRSVLLLTDDDVEFWDNYVLENPEKKQEIEAAKQLLSSMTFDDETYSEQEKLELLEHVNDQVKSIRRHRLYVGFYKIFAAACVVALLSVGVYSFFAPFTSDNQVATIEKNRSNFEKDTRLVIAGERTIPLEEGDDVLYGGGEATISSINQQDERYAVDVNDSKVEYNELIVPKGRRASHLVLEDGSKVWVNSGSTFRFPTTFEKNKREVYVDGEIYIDTKFHVDGVKCPATLGDCGSIDGNGMLHFLGRRDDMYNINGIKVSGLKVESALLDCGGVEDAAALAEKSGGKDLLTVFVVGRGLNKTGLLQKLHGKLTEHELPKRIIFIDALPKNESGKTDRKKLQTML